MAGRVKSAYYKFSRKQSQMKPTREYSGCVFCFHLVAQPVQEVGDRRDHPVPVRNEGRIKRVLQEVLTGDLKGLGEGLDDNRFLVGIEDEPVDRGAVAVALDRVLGRPLGVDGKRS